MACTDRRGPAEKHSLCELVEDFLGIDGCCRNDEIRAFRKLAVENSIKKAAQARQENGKCYTHQRRLRRTVRQKAETVLLEFVGKIRACNKFDVLYELVNSKLQEIMGTGEMYWYDTAFRIGVSMGIYPQKVYLHRGTRVGAKALGIYQGEDVLKMSELPAELQRMKPYQVEDFLCVFKGELHKFKTTQAADRKQSIPPP